MTVFLITLAIVGLAMAGLAVGLLMGRGPLHGSCGGNTVVKNCGICSNKEKH